MAFAAARMIKDKAKRPSNYLDLFPGQANPGGGPPYPLPRSASGRALLKGALARGHVKRSKCKGKNGKKGGKDTLDLIVTIDLEEWKLSPEQVAEFKEVFMLFDKDEDGVITFPELIMVMKSLGQRPANDDLLAQLREVSADAIYDTIEFNEFLQMMSKQQVKLLSKDSLKDAFSIFDKDDDGYISVEELRNIMKNLGDKMSDEELDEMIDLADPNHEGLVNYLEFVMMLAKDNGKKSSSHPGKSKKRSKPSTTTGKKKPDISKSSSNANIKTESGTNFVGIKTANSSENLLNNNAKNCHELKPIRGDKKVQRKSAVK